MTQQTEGVWNVIEAAGPYASLADLMQAAQDQADADLRMEMRRTIPALPPRNHAAAAAAMMRNGKGATTEITVAHDGRATLKWQSGGPWGMEIPVLVLPPGQEPQERDYAEAAATARTNSETIAVLIHSTGDDTRQHKEIIDHGTPAVRIRVVNLEEWVHVMIREETGIRRRSEYRILSPDRNLFPRHHNTGPTEEAEQ